MKDDFVKKIDISNFKWNLINDDKLYKIIKNGECIAIIGWERRNSYKREKKE